MTGTMVIVLPHENKFKDSADYAKYKNDTPEPFNKIKFRKMMVTEFKEVLMPEIAALI